MINTVLPTIAGVDLTERGKEDLSILEGVCWNTRLMSPRMTSDIIECDGWLVVKLYSLGVPREVVDREVRLTNLARSNGIVAPVIREVVSDEGRWGYSYERIEGLTMLELLVEGASDVDSLARSFARLHREVHQRSDMALPPLKDQLAEVIGAGLIPQELKEIAMTTLSQLPDGYVICHGDYHPGNIIVTAQSEVILDWVDAACGRWLADIARTLMLLEVWLPNEVRRKGLAVSDEALDRFLAVYRSHSLTTEGEEEEVRRWLLPVAVARMAQEVPGEAPGLTRLIEASMQH
jgi:tRNA A-37 threonylcarbamoyl transferase component Bud32